MKINALARQAGLSVHTLRYYEKAGLLKAARSSNNYREYSDDDLASARFIKSCKEAGFSLNETAALLAIKDDKSQHVCAEAKVITSNKIAQIAGQIEQLKKMQTTLERLNHYCCGGSESAEFCSIISALEGES